MPQLTAPDVRLHSSFLAAMDEFGAEGRGGPDDTSTLGRDMRDWSAAWHTPDGFARFTAALHTEGDPGAPLLPGRVHSTTLWWADGDTFLARIVIRHDLTDFLLNYGGHIGYDVRASVRRRGHATAMLRAALPRAADLGIEHALITCLTTNTASRKVIEACGGVFEDERGGQLRFWVPTSA
ncbi:Predicted acetyltransferase [Actinacidiphila rubida]|uniref:Predicted acetyltransferase n=1 Tax=Actinacidiphila rubida TaxID=310780 RepID=A0A1H8F1X9_9ACTN|nr:GNAT family N-acetyltransferase [Actinacidiphila rubida]SEN25394.1 Predicted acetyltransferase [Actinacidiphila rubida]